MLCLTLLAGPSHCPYQRCHDPVWLDAPGQAGTPQQAHSGQLWLLLTIIYGPLWLKTWELEIERLVPSQGTTLRYKTEATAAVRSRTPAKLCRPSAHPDKHELAFRSLPLYFPSSVSSPGDIPLHYLSWNYYLAYTSLIYCPLFLTLCNISLNVHHNVEVRCV